MGFFSKRLAVAAIALTGAFLFSGASAQEIKAVKITALVEHPALDAIRKGAIDEMAKEGFVDGKNIKIEFQSAQGEISTAGQIAKKFVGDNPALIIAIATPSAQAAVAAAHGSTPIVFSGVSDPVGSRLVKDWDHPGGNVTGVTDRLQLAKHLELIKEIVPNVKTVGVLFNSGEPNSVTEVQRFKKLAEAEGLRVVEGTAPNTNSVLIAARSLVGQADVFYVPTDNTVVSALEAVVKVAIDSKIPLIVGDTGSVPRGAAASVGFSYYAIGVETGRLAVRILNGEKPGDIGVQEVSETELVINPGSAARMGVTFPDSVLSRADVIVK